MELLLPSGTRRLEETSVDSVFTISPSEPETGIPITVSVKEKDLGVTELGLLISQNDSTPNRAELTAAPDGTRMAQFVLYQAGDYHLKVGGHETLIHISPRRDVSFLFELGFLTLSVIFILGGILIWNRKKRFSKAISS